MLWRANRYQTIIWTDIEQIMLQLWVYSATISWLYHFLSCILVHCSVVSLCNSFGNAAATARTTDNELHGYLTTWEGTRIIARVTSWHRHHYSDVMMSVMAYHITSLTIVYSTVYSGADQRKHQSSVSLAFVRGIHRWPVNSPHKWPVTQKMFPFDDVIMATSLIGFRYLFHKWFSYWHAMWVKSHFRKLYGKQFTFLCHHDFWKWKCTRNLDKKT